MTILLSDLSGNEIADGSGLATFMRTLGGSFAVSLATYMWNHRAVVHHAHLAMSQLDAMINRQAFQISFNEIFRGLAFVLMAMIVLIWMAKPPFFRAASSAPVGEHWRAGYISQS